MPESGTLGKGTVLAFDFGEKRIGVAVGEFALKQSHALTTIRCERTAERFSRISALIAEWSPAHLVVGLPLALDGSPHTMTARCTRFANQLRGRFGIEVSHIDERLTSVEAESQLRESGHRARSAREHLDAQSARIILQNFFDQLPVATSPTFPPDPTENFHHAPNPAS